MISEFKDAVRRGFQISDNLATEKMGEPDSIIPATVFFLVDYCSYASWTSTRRPCLQF